MSVQVSLKRLLGMGAALVLFLPLAAACGNDSSSASGSSSAKAPADVGGDWADKIATSFVGEVPTTGPAPAKNKSVWWMGCGNAVPDCKTLSDAGGEAAKLLGWDFHVADGKVNQGGGYAAAVRTALAAKPDALVIQGMDCSVIQQPLQEAKDQGVPVFGLQSLDCSEIDPSQPSLIPVKMQYHKDAETVQDYYEAIGKNAAAYLIGANDGKANVIANLGKGGFYEYMNKGFRDEMATCAKCEILKEVRWADADTAPNGPWIQAFTVALAKNPNANGVFIPFDSLMIGSGGKQAIKDSGLDLWLVGGAGNQAELLQSVRDGEKVALTNAQSFRQLSFGAMDNLNRYFAGEKQVPEGIGPTLIDAKHNLPAKGKFFDGSTDWLAGYKKLWGVS
ncbi:MAG: ABC-type sugar transport system periplasmic component-like protein [Marmoricola sp.]|jgi:ribose transport system substrate-binding protein|nr:ABC-type sugar transport system periplasmic component-like protein [Marmoricola sp.]